jgi:hypothetical protein
VSHSSEEYTPNSKSKKRHFPVCLLISTLVIGKEIYTQVPVKEIQSYLPLMLDRIAPIVEIYTKCVVGGHLTIV